MKKHLTAALVLLTMLSLISTAHADARIFASMFMSEIGL